MNTSGYLVAVILLGVIAVGAVGVSNYGAFTVTHQVSTTSQTTSTTEISTSSSSSTISSQTSQTTTSSTSSGGNGTLEALVSVGPIQPVCYVHPNSTAPPTSFSSEIVVTGPDGRNTTYPVSWFYDGCYVRGSLQVSLAPGDYKLSLSNCSFMGCRTELPRAFTIISGRTTVVDVSIFTGIV